MSTHAISMGDADTLRVNRRGLSAPLPDAPPRRTSLRLAEMDLDPPSGPVPSEVLAYFEAAVAREGRHRRG